MSVLVYDCFLFFNELDLLEIRLNVLSEVVDKFVLVEADKTFSNNKKPFYFEDNKERYNRFQDKIIHVKITEYPETKTTWEMQDYQRNQIARGIGRCSPNDVIIISDLDEIPNPGTIMNYKKTGNGIFKLKQSHFDYYLNYRRLGKNYYWYSAKITRYNDMLINNFTPQNVRSFKNVKAIKNAGWHFSFLGDMENIVYKIQSISMQKWNNEKYVNDKIEHKIRLGLDLFDRNNIRLIPIKITSKRHPEYIVDNKEKYAHLINLHVDKYVVIKNILHCLPYHCMHAIKCVIKILLPERVVTFMRNLSGKRQTH